MVAEMFLSWLGMDYWVRELSSTYPPGSWRFPALRPEKKLPQNGIGKEVVVFQLHHFSGAFAVQLSGVVTIMEPEINSREGEMVDQILYFQELHSKCASGRRHDFNYIKEQIVEQC